MLILWTSSPPFLLQMPFDPFCTHLQQAPSEIRNLLSEYPDVLSSDGFSASTRKHGVFHDLPTIPGPPVFAKAHQLDHGKLASAQAEFLKMEKARIVPSSSSPWSSPLHMVPKPDGTWRPCGNFCKLNTTTVPDRYPLPTIADSSARISGSKFFLNSICRKDIFKLQCAPLTFQRLPIAHPLASTSSYNSPLTSGMLLRHSRE